MPDVTHYVAPPFPRNEEGDSVPGEAQDRQSAHAAIRTAEEMARKHGDTVASSKPRAKPVPARTKRTLMRR